MTLAIVITALASDTLIGVVRARAIARHRHLGTALAADPATPLAALGGLLLWLLRLTPADGQRMALASLSFGTCTSAVRYDTARSRIGLPQVPLSPLIMSRALVAS